MLLIFLKLIDVKIVTSHAVTCKLLYMYMYSSTCSLVHTELLYGVKLVIHTITVTKYKDT